MNVFSPLHPAGFSQGAVDLEHGGDDAAETTAWPQITGEIALCTRRSEGEDGHGRMVPEAGCWNRRA